MTIKDDQENTGFQCKIMLNISYHNFDQKDFVG